MQWPLRSLGVSGFKKDRSDKKEKSPTPFSELVGSRYQIKDKLGSGSFGEVHLVADVETHKQYAVKLEHKSDVKRHLRTEYEVYNDLGDTSGFPKMLWFGKYGDYTGLVMGLCGPSLKDLYAKCNRRFGVKTTAQIAVQLLDRLEKLHNVGWLHQDIKPENCVVGLDGDSTTVSLIDYGTSARYIDPITNHHRVKGPSTKIVGTARYSSLNNHYGQKQSRRDDLESLGYTLVYWMIGKLPWQGIPDADFRVKWRKVRRIKRNTTPDELCADLPVEFRIYLKYVFKLSYSQRPNYSYLRGLFRRLIEREDENELNFSWEKMSLDKMPPKEDEDAKKE